MTEAQENELADMITDVAISYANGHATDFRIAAKAAVAFVTDAAPRISESDAAYWIANRASIIDAISKAGFKLMSNKNGFWLLNVQDDEPQTNATIDSYVVPLNGFEYTVQRVHQKDDTYLWKAMYGTYCLSKSGNWEYEPLPSSRDDAFLARCRFATAVDAINALTAAVAAQTDEDAQ